MAVGPLLAILGLLLGRARAVGASNVFFLLGFGLHLAGVGVALRRTLKDNAILDYIVDVAHLG